VIESRAVGYIDHVSVIRVVCYSRSSIPTLWIVYYSILFTLAEIRELTHAIDALVYYLAYVLAKLARTLAIHYYLTDRYHASDRLIASFKVDRVGETV
jgi:hypothetical protein